MREKLRKFKDYMFLLTCFVLYNPMIVKAAETAETAETDQYELGPVTKVIYMIVVIVVTAYVYRLQGRNTIVVGTRAGLEKEKTRRLVIAFICGLIAAAIVIWLLKLLFKIFIVLLIVAAVIGVIVFIVKMVSKKSNASAETSGEQMESKDAASVSVSASETENINQTEGNAEFVSEGDNAEISKDIQGSEDKGNSLRNILSKLDIHNSYVETGMPIVNGELIKKARKNFEIPASEKAYLICDNTVLGTCKTGFAICESGIYSRQKQLRYISWAEFKTTEIINNGFLRIGDDQYTVSGKVEGPPLLNIVYDALLKIKESIE